MIVRKVILVLLLHYCNVLRNCLILFINVVAIIIRGTRARQFSVSELAGRQPGRVLARAKPPRPQKDRHRNQELGVRNQDRLFLLTPDPSIVVGSRQAAEGQNVAQNVTSYPRAKQEGAAVATRD